MRLTPEQEATVKFAADKLAEMAVKDPKSGVAAAPVLALIGDMTPEEIDALAMDLLGTYWAVAAFMQRMVYQEPPNLLNLNAAGMAAAGMGEVLGHLLEAHPELHDRNASAVRASKAIGAARTLAITSTAAQIILPGGGN